MLLLRGPRFAHTRPELGQPGPVIRREGETRRSSSFIAPSRACRAGSEGSLGSLPRVTEVATRSNGNRCPPPPPPPSCGEKMVKRARTSSVVGAPFHRGRSLSLVKYSRAVKRSRGGAGVEKGEMFSRSARSQSAPPGRPLTHRASVCYFGSAVCVSRS